MNRHFVSCALFGNTEATKVTASVGAEQEYFLVDKDLVPAKKRPDVLRSYFVWCSRSKGQEMEDDHYFGVIRRACVYAFAMKDLK